MDGRYRVSIRGVLVASDLQSLERACRYALEQRELPLELDLREAAVADDAARAYIDRLRSRGAAVRAVL